MSFKAAVLLKQVLDPELPASRFEIDPELKAPPPDLGAEVLGPFEQSALEVALQLRDTGAAESVTAIIAGGPGSEESLRKALSLQVDHAVRIDTGDERNLDASQTAELLTRAIKTRDSLDVVLAGRQAGDWDQGQVGYLVAERLGWACVGLVHRLGEDGARLTAERELAGSHEVLSVAPPVLLTVTNADSNRLRMAKVMDLMAAKKKPIEGLTLGDLGLDEAKLGAARRTELEEVSVPVQERDCQLVEGEDAAAVASALVDELVARKLLGAAG
jgi:electron transfer flavoprotein beta subunit